MQTQVKQKRSLSLRLKIAAISLLSLVVTTACSRLRLHATPEPMCYVMVAPTDTPTPIVMCYEMVAPTETPTPAIFDSPLPTPTPTSTPQARRLLLDRLLVEGRFPEDVARQLAG